MTLADSFQDLRDAAIRSEIHFLECGRNGGPLWGMQVEPNNVVGVDKFGDKQLHRLGRCCHLLSNVSFDSAHNLRSHEGQLCSMVEE